MKSPILGLSGRYKPGDMSCCCAYVWLSSTHPLSWLKAPQWLFAMVKFELTYSLSRSSGFMISDNCLEGPYSILPKLVRICLRSRGRNLRLPVGTCHVNCNPFRPELMKATKPIMFRVRNIMIAFFLPCSDVTLRTLLFMMKVRMTKIVETMGRITKEIRNRLK
jgi:hypothetical protein